MKKLIIKFCSWVAYKLSTHKCKKVYDLSWKFHKSHNSEWWIGRLINPIKNYPLEKYCLHYRTPLRYGILFLDGHGGDSEVFALISYFLYGEKEKIINKEWYKFATEMSKIKES